MSKSSYLKWTYWRSIIENRVASLLQGNAAKGIIIESLNSVGKF